MRVIYILFYISLNLKLPLFKKRAYIKLLYVFLLIIICLIYNKIFAIKCKDLRFGPIYTFQDKKYLFLYQQQPHIDRPATIYFPKINSDKKNQKYFISGVVKKLDDFSFKFEFNICIDIDSEKSLITNYSDNEHNVSDQILELSEETPKIETEPLDFEVLESALVNPSTKRPKIETERQTPNYDKLEEVPLLSSSAQKETKFVFPQTTYIVYKIDNIILKIFPKKLSSDYKGFLIYNKLPFYIPFRELRLTNDGDIRIKLIGWLKIYNGDFTYKKEEEYTISKENLLLVDENDYEKSYKDLNFPDYFTISGCQILYHHFTNNHISNFSLQKNIVIDVKRMNDRIGLGGASVYPMFGTILINGKYYQTTNCKVTSSSSIIKYLEDGVSKYYSFNISDFII